MASQLPPTLRAVAARGGCEVSQSHRSANTKIIRLHQDDLQSILQLGLHAIGKMQRRVCRTLNCLGPNLVIRKFRWLKSWKSTPENKQCNVKLLIRILYYTDTLAVLHTLWLAPQCRCRCHCFSFQRRCECQRSMKDPHSHLDRWFTSNDNTHYRAFFLSQTSI